MATHTGSEGTVKVGTAGSDTAIAEIRSFSIEETADTLETTSMGDSSRTYVASLKQFTGSIDVFWDETNTGGQTALTVGASVTLNLYPEGATSGDTYYGGTAIVTGRTINSTFDGLVEMTISVQGSGALTETTV
jgi:predicted secreted protein|tara:strand:- start:810 stop:1211 length:402 start_codon:yes stop_codon:yes gene_type:complete